MPSVMLTGATGFIGSHIAEKLIQGNNPTHLFVRRKNSLIDLFETKSATIFVGYPDNKDVLKESLQGVEIVIHCAGATKARKEEDFFKANFEYTKNILSLLGKKQKFLFISSQAAAGPSHSQSPIDEKAESKPLTGYGKSKLLCENHIREWGKKNGNNYTILRPSVVYGPRERDMYNFFKLVKKGLMFVFGGDHKKISIIHIEDLVRGIMKAMEYPFSGETFFISNDKENSWEEIGNSIKKALNKTFLLKVKLPEVIGYPLACFFESVSLVTQKPALINREKITEMKQPAWVCSNKKIKETLHWKPELSLEKGIKQTADWYIKEKWL